MTWVNAPRLTPTNKIGFVYQITELDTGMIYIGQAKFWRINKKAPTKYKRLDGKFLKDKAGKRILNTRTTRKHTKVETAWRNYNSSCGSNAKLQEHIVSNPQNYKKEILQTADCKMDLNCWEAYIQLDYWVSGNWDKLYNKVINLRGRVPDK